VVGLHVRNQYLNVARNRLRVQDEGRWFSADRFVNGVMPIGGVCGQEVNLSSPAEQRQPGLAFLVCRSNMGFDCWCSVIAIYRNYAVL
jgi:hypothetical protein